MEFIGAGMFIAVGIYYGLVAVATAIIRGAVLLSGRRDIEKQIEEGK